MWAMHDTCMTSRQCLRVHWSRMSRGLNCLAVKWSQIPAMRHIGLTPVGDTTRCPRTRTRTRRRVQSERTRITVLSLHVTWSRGGHRKWSVEEQRWASKRNIFISLTLWLGRREYYWWCCPVAVSVANWLNCLGRNWGAICWHGW